jgi:hypothetical protein
MVCTVKLYAIAVLLFIVQASVPIPGQTTNTPSSSRQAIEDPSDKEQTAPPSPTVKNETKPEKKHDNVQNSTNTDRREPIRISELPAVSISRDWMDRVSLFFTACLVAIGTAGSLFALRTLKSIERQTKAIIQSQRAKIAASAQGDYMTTVVDRGAPRVQIGIVNRGLATANNFVYESWVEVVAFPFDDFSEMADRFSSTVPQCIYPQHEGLVLNVPFSRPFTPEQRLNLQKGAAYVCVRLNTTYEDGFGSMRNASFCFYVYPGGFAVLPKYNWDKEAV